MVLWQTHALCRARIAQASNRWHYDLANPLMYTYIYSIPISATGYFTCSSWAGCVDFLHWIIYSFVYLWCEYLNGMWEVTQSDLRTASVVHIEFWWRKISFRWYSLHLFQSVENIPFERHHFGDFGDLVILVVGYKFYSFSLRRNSIWMRDYRNRDTNHDCRLEIAGAAENEKLKNYRNAVRSAFDARINFSGLWITTIAHQAILMTTSLVCTQRTGCRKYTLCFYGSQFWIRIGVIYCIWKMNTINQLSGIRAQINQLDWR